MLGKEVNPPMFAHSWNCAAFDYAANAANVRGWKSRAVTTLRYGGGAGGALTERYAE